MTLHRFFPSDLQSGGVTSQRMSVEIDSFRRKSQCMMGTGLDFLVSDYDSIQSEDIKRVWHFWANYRTPIVFVCHNSSGNKAYIPAWILLSSEWLESLVVCDPEYGICGLAHLQNFKKFHCLLSIDEYHSIKHSSHRTYFQTKQHSVGQRDEFR